MQGQLNNIVRTLFKHYTTLAPACVLAKCHENLNKGEIHNPLAKIW